MVHSQLDIVVAMLAPITFVPSLDKLIIESLVTKLGEPGYLAISQGFLESLCIFLLLLLVL